MMPEDCHFDDRFLAALKKMEENEGNSPVRWGFGRRKERRNMEIELKYNIQGKEKADEIWADPELTKFFEEDSQQTNFMKAIYFDTADRRLGKEEIAFRVRLKGSS